MSRLGPWNPCMRTDVRENWGVGGLDLRAEQFNYLSGMCWLRCVWPSRRKSDRKTVSALEEL